MYDLETHPTKKKTFIQGILIVVGVMFCFQFGARYVLIHFYVYTGPGPIAVLISSSYYWLLTLGIWIYTRQIERQRFSLWKEEKYGFLTYLLSVLGIVGTIIIASGIVHSILFSIFHHTEKSAVLDQMIKIFARNKLLLVFATFTAGVTEELIFRVYLLQRLEFVLKSPGLSIAISTILFSLMHLGYGTISNVLGPFIIGGTFAIHYQRFRNIKFIIILHFLWDLFVFSIMTRGH
jgi:uncharacterized protein